MIGMICVTAVIPFFCFMGNFVSIKQKKGGIHKKYMYILFLLFVFVMTGFLYAKVFNLRVDKIQAFCNESISFEGFVCNEELSGKQKYYLIKINRIGDERACDTHCRTQIRIALLEQENITVGDMISGKGDAKKFKNATNPGGYDEENYQYGRGVFLDVENVKLTKVKKRNGFIRYGLFQFREQIKNIYKTVFDEKDASLATAMVLGDKSELDKDVKKSYQENGIAHLIAISGLHIAMLGGALYGLLRKVIGGYGVPVMAGSILVVAYGLMTGMSGATTRALIMLLVRFFADFYGRKYDALTAMGLALFLMSIQNPFILSQAGFALSYGAIVGITVIHPIGEIVWPKHPRLLDGLFLSVSVQIVLIPVMLYYFYEVPTYGFVLNVIVVPLMSVLLACLVFTGLSGICNMMLAHYVSLPGKIIFKIYLFLCEVTERFPFHTWNPGKISIWCVMIYYLWLICLTVCIYRWNIIRCHMRRSVIIVLLSVMFVSVLIPFVGKQSMQVCMFDVGQGDGIYIRSPKGRHILVDGGSSTNKNVGSYVLENGLKYYGARSLDYVIVTHSDSDHYVGIQTLLENERFQIKHFVLPFVDNPDEAYLMLVELARKKGCNIYQMCKGDEIHTDGVVFTCLNPEKKTYQDKNTGCLVLQLKYKEYDMLLSGDMDESVEEQLMKHNLIKDKIDVLKVSHHGSDSASSERFLLNYTPTAALVSVGEKNRYGHPSVSVMERLMKYCENIYLTKDVGAITIETDGYRFRISGFNET